jgi:hypothetical protein
MLDRSFLTVERLTPKDNSSYAVWQVVATDADWETK